MGIYSVEVLEALCCLCYIPQLSQFPRYWILEIRSGCCSPNIASEFSSKLKRMITIQTRTTNSDDPQHFVAHRNSVQFPETKFWDMGSKTKYRDPVRRLPVYLLSNINTSTANFTFHNLNFVAHRSLGTSVQFPESGSRILAPKPNTVCHNPVFS